MEMPMLSVNNASSASGGSGSSIIPSTSRTSTGAAICDISASSLIPPAKENFIYASSCVSARHCTRVAKLGAAKGTGKNCRL